VVARPRVETFAALARRVLADAGKSVRTLSAFRRHLLLRSLVGDLHRRRALPTLGSVADSPGLIDSVDRSISELKRAAVDPDTLARAVGETGGKARDLLKIYRGYQDHLQRTDTYDLEGQMWLARDVLATAPPESRLPALDGVRAVLVDGFTDFTPTQLSVLALATARVQRVVITLPWSEDGRDRLWRWTARTRERIRAELGEGLVELMVGEADSREQHDGGGRALWACVFGRDFPTVSRPEGVSVIAATGIEAEVVAVARRVKRLLIQGEPSGDVLVTARSMKDYRPVIDRVFSAYGIPVSAGVVSLAEAPLVRFVLDVASLSQQFLFRDVLRVIKNSYFRPDALGEFDASTVADAEALIRKGNVFAHRESYARAGERLQRTVPDQQSSEFAEGVHFSPPDYRKAAEMLERLFGLATDAGLAELVEALALHQSGMAQGDPALIAGDLRALAQMEALLAEGDLPTDLSPLALRRALGVVPCPAERGESMVKVMDVLDARCVRARHVFLLGLGEGRFPQHWSENSLVGEAERSAWSRRGVALDSRSDLSAREMLLFYLATSRSDDGLTLSYLASDASGRAGAPGGFLESLAEPAGGLEALPTEEIPPGQFLPPEGQAAAPTEAINAAVAGLFGEGDEAGPPLAWLAERPEWIDRCARGIWTYRRRWEPGACDAYDGRLSDPALLSAMELRFGEEAVFSAAMLEAYGQCPWLFFARYVLHIQPLVEPERTLEAATRGLFCHDVLRETFVTLREQGGGPVALFELGESAVLDALKIGVEAASRRIERRGVAYPGLWRIQRDRMHKQIARYLRMARDQEDLDSRSLHFELAFGLEGAAMEGADGASVPEAGVVETPHGRLRLRGRIDRVDQVQWEGDAGLLVVDYKTGALPTKADWDEGRSLQAALYAVVVEGLLRQPMVGGIFHHVGEKPSERSFARFTRRAGKLSVNKNYEEQLAAALARAGEFVRAMRAGQFDSIPTRKCPSYCSYRTICQYSESRAARKVAPAEGEGKSE
jgi:ATP-dependent helicase/nuclease subunit B